MGQEPPVIHRIQENLGIFRNWEPLVFWLMKITGDFRLHRIPVGLKSTEPEDS